MNAPDALRHLVRELQDDTERLGVRSGVHGSAYLAQLMAEYAGEQSAHLQGRIAGCALHEAHELVDRGANPRYVRQLLELGLRAGGAR